MTIRVRASGVKIIAGCLFAIAAILGTLALTVVNSSANPQSADPCGAPTGTPAPDPTATATPAPKASQLCDSVSSKGGSGVSPGASAPFSIQVSTTGGTASNVVVTISANTGAPRFTACPGNKTGTDSNHYPTCTLTTLNGSQTILAAVDVPASAANGQNVTLTVTTYSTDPAINVPGASASIPVVKSAPGRPSGGSGTSGTGGTSGGGGAGAGGTSPGGTTGGSSPAGSTGYGSTGYGSAGAGSAGGVSAGVPVASAVTAGTGDPLAYTAGPLRKFLPLINGGSPTKGNGGISAQLPSIPPTGTLPTAKPAGYHGIASGPLSRKMLGTQLIGLAALCAAIGIVLIRFWRRTPRPPVAGRAAVAVAGGAPAGGAAAGGAAAAADAASTGATTDAETTTGTAATAGAGGKTAAGAKTAAGGGAAAVKAPAGTSPSVGRGRWRRFLRGRHAKPS